MEINSRFPVFPRTDLFALETGQDEDEHEGQDEDDFVIINFEEIAHHLSQSGHKNILSRPVRTFNVARNLINPSEQESDALFPRLAKMD
ncbi:MAG: hypothetical protein DWI02_12435 [Planctomycetota bacterium]|nr:MAG: hypothetical protein DWI02_12435 [Planctomycetota bacterium]